MRIAKWLIPVACVGTSLLAQSNDINGLVSAAGKYMTGGMQASQDPETLGLCKMLGHYSDKQQNVLMHRAVDVGFWTFLYRINGQPEPQPGPDCAPTAPNTHKAVTAECNRGVFGNFHFSDKPVQGLHSLENTWVAASLDAAVAGLNAAGYTRGFTSVSIERPDLAGWPDDLVYVFDCPLERRQVGVSCQTGQVTWTYGQ